MKKGPEIRIIGDVSPEKKEQAKEEIEQAVFNHFESLSAQEREQLEKFEYPKSKKEIAIINFANKETDELMKEFGIEPYDVPAENYHIIPSELYKKLAGGSGIARTANTKQGVVFDAQHFRNNPVYFGSAALHETLHLKAHFSLEIEEGEEGGDKIDKTLYREGVGINALQRYGFHGKYHSHFTGLDEAIVAETEKRLLPKLLDRPELKEERKWLMSDEAKKIKKNLAEKEEISEDDIIWVGKNEESDRGSVAYRRQREVLNYLCAEIQKQFPEQFQSTDDIFKIFLKAHFTGQLLQIARLVEETFGEGSFRLLGNMDAEKESGVLHLESLKKARARQIKPHGTKEEPEEAKKDYYK